MENKIMPTAEEFIQNFIIKSHKPHSLNDRGNAGSNTEWLMIEFARMHVEAALYAKGKAMKEKSYEDSSFSIGELDAFTGDCYPLENIK